MNCTDGQPCFMIVVKMNLVIQETLRKQSEIDVVHADVRCWLLIEGRFAIIALPILEFAVSLTDLASFALRQLPVIGRDR